MKETGNGIIVLGLLVWVSISVGPWWIGCILFLCGMLLNLSVMLVKERKK